MALDRHFGQTASWQRKVTIHMPRLKEILARKTDIAFYTIAVLLCSAYCLHPFRYYLFPRNFRVVEQSEIFSGARQKPRVLRNLIQQHKIRTIIALDDKFAKENFLKGRDPGPYLKERALARELQLEYHGFNWKGTGIGSFDEFDNVADILAKEDRRPIFVHCKNGQERTGAALAAYWIRHHDISAQEALALLSHQYGFEPQKEPRLVDCLRRYEAHQQQLERSGHLGENAKLSESQLTQNASLDR